jgi:hypothetical protein
MIDSFFSGSHTTYIHSSELRKMVRSITGCSLDRTPVDSRPKVSYKTAYYIISKFAFMYEADAGLAMIWNQRGFVPTDNVPDWTVVL